MLLCLFFLIPVVLNSFFMIPVLIENAKLKHVLAIPTGAPIMLAKETMETPPLVADKILKVQNSQSRQYI